MDMVTGIEKRYEERTLIKQETRTTMISCKKNCEYLNIIKKKDVIDIMVL